MMDNHILFIGCLYSDNQKDIFMKASKRGYQFAAQNFQEALLDGFLANNVDIKVLSIPSLSTFPKGNKLFRIKDDVFSYKNKELGRSFGYINIFFLNRPKNEIIDNYVEEWYKSNKGKKTVVVYALLKEQMAIALRAKKMYPDLKISIIILDLPRYMGCNRYYKLFGFQKQTINWIYKNINLFDAFVILSKYMLDDLGIEKKSYVVIEGIYTPPTVTSQPRKTNYYTILYTGNMGARYGVDKLIAAFERIKENDFRLWIRGFGDKSRILSKIEIDPRIQYIGPMEKSKLMDLQKEAHLLVNPVSSEQEFTRYFFPSKTMDYMASATPTLMCHLPCIPPEYDDYLFYFEDESIEGMAKRMEEICKMPKDILEEKGKKASEFVLTQKSSSVQVKKILKLLETL